MPPVIEPTVGRIMLFREWLPGMRKYGEPRAALVASVEHGFDLSWSGWFVNLTVSQEDGSTMPVQRIRVVQEGEDHPMSKSFAHWMEYQVGQAAKSDQIQKDAAQLAFRVGELVGAMEKKLKDLEKKVDGRFTQFENFKAASIASPVPGLVEQHQKIVEHQAADLFSLSREVGTLKAKVTALENPDIPRSALTDTPA